MKNMFIVCILSLLLIGCGKKIITPVLTDAPIQRLADGAIIIAEEQEIFPLNVIIPSEQETTSEEIFSLDTLDIDEIELIPAFQLDMRMSQ